MSFASEDIRYLSEHYNYLRIHDITESDEVEHAGFFQEGSGLYLFTIQDVHPAAAPNPSALFLELTASSVTPYTTTISLRASRHHSAVRLP